MKVLVKRQTTEDVEMDINLPYYCKSGSNYYKVISEDKAIQVTENSAYSLFPGVAILCAGSHILGKGHEQITQDEFESAYKKVLTEIEMIICEPILEA